MGYWCRRFLGNSLGKEIWVVGTRRGVNAVTEPGGLLIGFGFKYGFLVDERWNSACVVEWCERSVLVVCWLGEGRERLWVLGLSLLDFIRAILGGSTRSIWKYMDDNSSCLRIWWWLVHFWRWCLNDLKMLAWFFHNFVSQISNLSSKEVVTRIPDYSTVWQNNRNGSHTTLM